MLSPYFLYFYVLFKNPALSFVQQYRIVGLVLLCAVFTVNNIQQNLLLFAAHRFSYLFLFLPRRYFDSCIWNFILKLYNFGQENFWSHDRHVLYRYPAFLFDIYLIMKNLNQVQADCSFTDVLRSNDVRRFTYDRPYIDGRYIFIFLL